MYGKVHTIQGTTVLACCDKDLIGRVIKEGELELEASEEFYKDREFSEEELHSLLEEADSVNLLGENAVGVALKKGFLNERDVIKIEGIPHAQIFRI